MNRVVDQLDSFWWIAGSATAPVGALAMLNLAICERGWPSTAVKFPIAISPVFCGLTEICSASVTAPPTFGLCRPERTGLK